MNSESKRNDRRKRGSTTAFFAIGMIPMVGIMSLAIELGNVAVHQRRLQNYVDSKAVAAVKLEFGNGFQPIEYRDFLDGVGGAAANAIDAQPEKGHWSFTSFNGGSQFTETSNESLSAGSVPAYRFEVDPFDVPLMFGALFNVPSVQIRAESVAFAPRREVVIVQDVSTSMCRSATGGGGSSCQNLNGSLMQAARNAGTGVVNLMDSQNYPGDQVGVVGFSGVNDQPLIRPMQPLDGNAGAITGFINNNLVPIGGTDVPTGLNAGFSLFGPTAQPNPEVERILILIGDGRDFVNSPQSVAALTAAANANFGINVFSIMFCPGQCAQVDVNYYRPLPSGNGVFRQAPTPQVLAQLLTDIVTGVPMKLVR